MAVFAANITEDTVDLLNDILGSNKFVKFGLQTKLCLSDNTVLIRLALINLMRHLPSESEIGEFRAALLRPSEFDDFLKEEV